MSEPIWFDEQMTREEAIAFAESGAWKNMTDKQLVEIQLFTQLTCYPFSRFHQAIEACLGRPVYIHELASSNLRNVQDEFLGDRPAPSLLDVIGLIPEEKRIVIERRS